MHLMQMETFPFIFFYFLISCLIIEFSAAADTITPNQSITNGETLVSSGQSFELGFFSPGGSNNLYLGMWYKKIPENIVWVGNRENPITDSHGILTISSDGHLVLLNGRNSLIWSSNSSRTAQNSVAQLLDSGNLVLRVNSDSGTENYVWQSFDFPSDTQLPDMKLGWNLETGLNRFLTSWKSASDPSPGDFIFTVDVIGLPQLVLLKGSEKKYRTGLWNGLVFSGAIVKSSPVYTPTFVSNTDELYFMYKSSGGSMITRFGVNQSGFVQRFVLSEGSSEWTIMSITPSDQCEDYGRCGANGICKINKGRICECLQGFTPKVQREWDVFDWSSGCTRTPLNCHEREGFVKLKNVKLPDLLEFWLNESISLKECEAECLKDCSCTAYANSDIRGRGSGCLIWFGDLIDIREIISGDSKQDIYIRMPASELDHNQKGKRLVLIVIISTVSGVLVLGFLTWCMIWKKRTKRGQETDKDEIELPFFDMVTIATATKNFSCTNMIGEGGFGPVYKGNLSTGQEIAVNRLSNNSGQGLPEFKNEVILISKLQHRNLVKLLGCCIEGEERMIWIKKYYSRVQNALILQWALHEDFFTYTRTPD